MFTGITRHCGEVSQTSPLSSFGATGHDRVQAAICEVRAGKPVILVDDESRENEGDLVIAAEKATADNINFLIRHGSGIVCLSLTEDKIERLRLPLMVEEGDLSCPSAARFTVSIEAREGVTTGVSAADRATTIRAAVSESAKPEDFWRPGHVFPLRAKRGGLSERQGHTEGSVALAQLAGLKPAAAICELMNSDGTMARLHDSIEFAKVHNLTILSIQDLMENAKK